MHSSLIGNKIILWSNATLVAYLLQVTDWRFALEPRNLIKQSASYINITDYKKNNTM